MLCAVQVDPNVKGFEPRGDTLSKEAVLSEFAKPTDKRIFAIAQVIVLCASPPVLKIFHFFSLLSLENSCTWELSVMMF